MRPLFFFRRSLLVLASMAGVLFAASSAPTRAQDRLIPPPRKGETKFPELYCYFRPEGPEYTIRHPRYFSLFKTIAPTRVPAHLEAVRGRDFIFRALKTGVRFPFRPDEMLGWESLLLDSVYVVRGEVRPFPQPDDRAAALEKERLISLEYVRPPSPLYALVGGARAEYEFDVEHRLPFLFFEPPQAATSREPLPLIIFLHGIGGDGTDNWAHFAEDGGGAQNHFLNFTREDWQKQMPCYVMAPQSWMLDNNWWSDEDTHHWPLMMVNQAVDVLMGKYGKKIDPTRLYVTGLSGGAAGCFELLRRFPGRYAAAVPVAAGYRWNTVMPPDGMAPVYCIVNEKDRSIRWKDVRQQINPLEAFQSGTPYADLRRRTPA